MGGPVLTVLEGPDKSGKTTVAKALAKAHGLDYVHFGPPREADPAAAYVKFLINLKRPTVCDRFFVSEMIYGPLLRGTAMKRLDRLVLERVCRRTGVQQCLLNTSLDSIRPRFDEAAEGLSWTTHERAWRKYQDLWPTLTSWRMTQLPAHTWDMLPWIVEQLGAHLSAQEDIHRSMHDFGGIGTIARRAFVLVGESINPNTTRFGLPFDGGPTAEFLQTMLDEAGVEEADLYLVNQDRLIPLEASFHQGLGSTFVALGALAAHRLKPLVKFQTLPHPQYWRRFHHARWREYADWLRGAYQRYQHPSSINQSSILPRGTDALA